MLRDGVHKRLGLTTCKFLATLHIDAIHLQGPGRILWADYITNILWLAERWLAANAPELGVRCRMACLTGCVSAHGVTCCWAPRMVMLQAKAGSMPMHLTWG